LFLKLGKQFGSLAYHLDGRHRKIALKNISSALPELEQDQAINSIHNCYKYFGMYLFDLLRSLHGSNKMLYEKCEYVGIDHLQSAYEKKKGVILFTGHFGAWEAMAAAQAYKGYPMSVVARKLDNPYLEKLLRRFRTSTGNSIIEKTEGFRPMLRTLKEGKAIAILIDQNVTTEDRIFVDFFGRPASTTPALALLKLKTDADLIPCFSIPLPDGSYRFEYGAPIETSLTGERKQDIFQITQACTTSIEQAIRNHPQYWLWMHRRWKTQPSAGELDTILTTKTQSAHRAS
jgi:KDO2-lipid IV(A) lauroyltransferase